MHEHIMFALVCAFIFAREQSCQLTAHPTYFNVIVKKISCPRCPALFLPTHADALS